MVALDLELSINIPTYNSEKTLETCLGAIKNQDYKKYEIIIIDSKSKDKTVDIAKKYGCKIIQYPGKLLGARYIGAKKSKGKYILMLDSDQVLKKGALTKCIKYIHSNDMLVLEEHTFKTEKFLEKLFEMDRKLIHSVRDFSPLTGVMLPRFYKKELLITSFEKIPEDIRYNVAGQDHAIIYYEAYKLSKKVEIVPDAVLHIEPNTLPWLWKKFYRWGNTSRELHKIKHYKDLLQRKERFRKGLFIKNNFKNSISSVVLTILKGIPFKVGYFFGEKPK